MAEEQRVVVMGRIGGAFGVAGWVKVQSFTDPPDNLLKFPVWLLRRPTDDTWQPVRQLEGRAVSAGLQARLEGTASREEAALLRGCEIGVRRSELPPLRPGEFYWDDLLGLNAYSPEGAALGQVVEIVASPAHPLLRLADASGSKRDVLVPLVRERLKSVDIAGGRVTLDWQPDWLRDE